MPQRRQQADEQLAVPPLSALSHAGTNSGRPLKFQPPLHVRVRPSCCAIVAPVNVLLPIMVDESRTFGMEGLFRQIGIFSQVGQLYEPVDKDQVVYYREDKAGQILQRVLTKPVV